MDDAAITKENVLVRTVGHMLLKRGMAGVAMYACGDNASSCANARHIARVGMRVLPIASHTCEQTRVYGELFTASISHVWETCGGFIAQINGSTHVWGA